MFLWLVVALIVDGIDGPLARRYDTPKNLPIYDGVLMDLIVDYLTYVFIPAYALFKSGHADRAGPGWLAIIVICYGSVIYFADTRMKTKDKSFCRLSGLLEHGGAGAVCRDAAAMGDSGDRGRC